MADLTLRSVKDAPLTNNEVDGNFTSLNTAKYESGDSPTFADIIGDTLQFTGGSGTQGTLSWNSDEETVDLIQDGATLQIGQEVQYHVRNNSGSTITDGTPVMATGTIGNSSRITVSPMDGTDIANAKYFLGIATEDIANDSDGKVTFFGKVRSIDTSGYSDGDVLWISTTTAGALTATEPTSGIKLPIAYVIHAHANGSIFVRATSGHALHESHDVSITSVTTNDYLKYDGSNWINTSVGNFSSVTTTGDVSVGGDLKVTGNATINGNLTFGDAATDTVAFGADVNSNFIPDIDDTYDLGSSIQEWRNLYIDGTANIDSLVADTADINGGTVDGTAIGSTTASTGNFSTLSINGTAITATSAELNVLDGITATVNELNILDGVTATTSELNTLDGITATVTELNYTDGVTSNIQTQLDSKANLSGAAFTGAITTTSTIDGRDIATDGAKLDGIESGATADQTASEILTAVKTVDGAGSGLDADLLDGQHGSYYTGYTDTAVANLVDSAPATLDTLNELAAALGDDANFSTTVTNSIALKAPLASPTFTGTVTIPDATVTGDVSFGDNDKAIFGAGSDLEIYHDGSNSYISDVGTGDLKIQGANVRLENPSGVRYFQGSSGVSYLYNSGDIKLNTTSTGIDVTGVITTDGMTTSADINFGDNDKAIFGAGSDLQIYHDGSHSYVSDQGTGNLLVRGENILLQKADGTENYLRATPDDAVQIYYNGLEKLATTATGIDVTGTVTSDDKIFIESGNPYIAINDTDITDLNTMIRTQSGVGYINTINDAYDTVAKRLGIDHATGDISFYENTGTTAKFFWNAGLERLGIGTTTPSTTLGVEGNATINGSLLFTGSTDRIRGGVNQPFSIDSRGNASGEGVKITHNSDAVALFDINGDISFYEDTGTTPKFFWDASAESLGIGTTSPTSTAGLHIQGADGASGSSVNVSANEFFIDNNGNTGMTLGSSNTGTGGYVFADSNVALRAGMFYTHSTDQMSFRIASQTRVSIDSTGNVGIGTTSPSSDLHIASSLATIRLEDSDIAGGAAYSLITGSSAGNMAFSADPDNVRSSSDFRFNVDGSERLRIDSSGNIRLTGTGALAGDNLTAINFYNTSSSLNLAAITGFRDSGGTNYGGLKFSTTNAGTISERMRINTSGDLLVGCTTFPGTTTGVEGASLGSQGWGSFSRDGNIPLYVTRAQDGALAYFYSGTTLIGRIAAGYGDLYIGTGDTGLRFADVNETIYPVNPSTLATRDGEVSLGASAGRFKDLYLSGGVYLGGTGAANKLDDYEEGTFTVTPTFGTSGSATLDRDLLSYTKIGQVVYITGQIQFDVLSSPTGRLSINAPFAQKSEAGSDRETNSFFCGTFQSLDAAPPTGTDGDQLWFTINGSEIELFFYNGYTNTATEIDTTYLKTASRINITGWYLTT